jgi:hypothetical protein
MLAAVAAAFPLPLQIQILILSGEAGCRLATAAGTVHNGSFDTNDGYVDIQSYAAISQASSTIHVGRFPMLWIELVGCILAIRSAG